MNPRVAVVAPRAKVVKFYRGRSGNPAFVYIAYASDDQGTGFTMTFNAALDYIAIKATTTEITNPQASDFAGLWKNYKGGAGPIDVTLPLDYLIFKEAPTLPAIQVPGLRYWDNENLCPATVIRVDEFGVPTSTLQEGQELPLPWRNDDAVQHYNGQPVYISGGTGKRAKVKLADASTLLTGQVVAMATENTAAGQIGRYTVFGNVTEFPYSQVIATTDDYATQWVEGAVLYLSTETGKLTVTPPTGTNIICRVGEITEIVGNNVTVLCDPHVFELNANEAAAVAQLFGIYTDTKEPTGWVDPENIVRTYDAANRTVILSHSSGFVRYRWRGIEYSLTSPWTSPAHLTVASKYYLKSVDGTTPVWSTQPWPFSDFQVAIVSKDAVNNTWIPLGETHGLTLDSEAHRILHDRVGTYRESGFGLTPATYALNTATDAATTPGFEAGVIRDEDLPTTIAATSEGAYTTVRIGASNVTTFDLAATFPFRSSGSYILVNNPTTGAETAALPNRYVNVYEVLLPVMLGTESQKYRRVLLQPQAQFNSLTAAQAEDFRTLVLGDLDSPEYCPYVRLTYLTAAGNTNTGKCTLAGISYVVGGKANPVNLTVDLSTKMDVLANTVEVTAIPTLTDSYAATDFIHSGDAQSVSLPTGTGLADGFGFSALALKAQITFATQNQDLLLNKDSHTKTAATFPALVAIQREATGLDMLTVGSLGNIAIGDRITTSGGKKGTVVYIVGTTKLFVRTDVGTTWAINDQIDDVDPYVGPAEATVSAVTNNVTIYSLIGQTAA